MGDLLREMGQEVQIQKLAQTGQVFDRGEQEHELGEAAFLFFEDIQDLIYLHETFHDLKYYKIRLYSINMNTMELAESDTI